MTATAWPSRLFTNRMVQARSIRNIESQVTADFSESTVTNFEADPGIKLPGDDVIFAVADNGESNEAVLTKPDFASHPVFGAEGCVGRAALSRQTPLRSKRSRVHVRARRVPGAGPTQHEAARLRTRSAGTGRRAQATLLRKGFVA